MMKRILFFILLILLVSISACTTATPEPVIDYVPLAPTSTPAEPVVAELATATPMPEATATRQTAKNTATPEPTQPQAQMPPLETGGWQRVTDDWLSFSFELPDHWSIPEGSRLYWTPDGVVPDAGMQIFGINPIFNGDPQDSDYLPGNLAVESRSDLEVNHFQYKMVKVKLFNGPNGEESAYQTYVIVPDPKGGRAYAFYVSAADDQSRAAMEDILLQALQTIVYNQ